MIKFKSKIILRASRRILLILLFLSKLRPLGIKKCTVSKVAY